MVITFLTFNYGTAGRYANGPGMCLFNFVKMLSKLKNVKINIFSVLKSPYKEAKTLNSINEIRKVIEKSDVVHHWSGLNDEFGSLCAYAKKIKKHVVVGPNLIDCVEFEKEKKYLSRTRFDSFLVVNDRLKYIVSKKHNIPINSINTFMVGPDLNLWKPVKEKEDFILWKGNSKQFVKDVKFGVEVAKKLKNKYRFEFIGYPKPYDYLEHIGKAKKAKLYICTSLSETMGLSLLEQWAAGIPSVTHPKIYMHGENYKTGIITNRTVNDYIEAIEEIMENDDLYNRLSIGSRNFTSNSFSDGRIMKKYFQIIRKLEVLYEG